MPASITDQGARSNPSERWAGFTLVGIVAVGMLGLAAIVVLMWWSGKRIRPCRVEASTTARVGIHERNIEVNDYESNSGSGSDTNLDDRKNRIKN